MRRPMNVERIRGAFRARVEELQRRDPSLTSKRISQRAGRSTKTMDNLIYDRPKTSFDLDVLRDFSEAIEWPRDGLERIESGDARPEDLPDVPWDEEDDDPIELEQQQLREEIEGIRRQVDALTKLVRELGGQQVL